MKVETKTCIKVGVSVFLLFLAIYYWKAVCGFVGVFFGAAMPLVVGGIIAYLINILMSFYEKFYFPKKKTGILAKTRRIVCMLAAMLTLVAILALITTMIVPQLIDCIKVIFAGTPKVVAFVIEKLNNMEWIPKDFLADISFDKLESRMEQMIGVVVSGVGGAMDIAVKTVSTTFSGIVTFFIGFIFAIYLLMGKEKLAAQCKRVLRTYVKRSWNEKFQKTLRVVDDCFHRYIVGQCIEAVILGALCTIGMLILRLPYATMIGPLIAVCALIPIAGAYIGAFVGAFMILTVSPFQALIFLIFLVILQQFEGNVIYPRVVGSSLGLPGLWVLAAVTVGGSLMGILGMMLAVPLVSAIYRLVREDVQKKKVKAVLFYFDEDFAPMDKEETLVEASAQAKEAVLLAKEKGFQVVCYGLDSADEELAPYIAQENNRASTDLYRDLVETNRLSMKECLMVGNNVAKGLKAKSMGMKVFFLTEGYVPEANADVLKNVHGHFEELKGYIQEL